jgi:hypothetical protein
MAPYAFGSHAAIVRRESARDVEFQKSAGQAQPLYGAMFTISVAMDD